MGLKVLRNALFVYLSVYLSIYLSICMSVLQIIYFTNYVSWIISLQILDIKGNIPKKV